MRTKEYKLPNGRTAVFEFDENGVGKVTLEAMDLLMGMVNIDIVRCVECKYQDGCYQMIEHRVELEGDAYGFHEVHFCSHGERRADE